MARKTIYSPGYRRLVEQLRIARERSGMTQVQLSRALNWSQQRLSAVETGSRRLDVLEFIELVGALDLTPDEALHLLMEVASASEALLESPSDPIR